MCDESGVRGDEPVADESDRASEEAAAGERGIIGAVLDVNGQAMRCGVMRRRNGSPMLNISSSVTMEAAFDRSGKEANDSSCEGSENCEVVREGGIDEYGYGCVAKETHRHRSLARIARRRSSISDGDNDSSAAACWNCCALHVSVQIV